MRVWSRLREEVIDRFGLRLATEPLTVPAHLMARRRFGIPWTQPAEPGTSSWPCMVNRPGLDLYAGPCEKPAGAYHRGSFALVQSTSRGLNAQECVREVCDKRASAILPRGVFELGARIRGHRLVTSDIRAFDTFLSSMKHHQVLCLICMLSVCLVCMLFKAYLGRDPPRNL